MYATACAGRLRRVRYAAFLATLIVVAATVAAVSVPASAQLDPPLPRRAVLPMIAADGAVSAAEAALMAAEARWHGSRIESYSMTVTITRFGPSETHRVVVQGERVVAVESECGLFGTPLACRSVDFERLTVSGLFAFVRNRIARVEAAPATPPGLPGQPFVDVTYDPLLGYPKAIAWGVRLLPDAGEGIAVTDFVVLARR